MFWFGLVPVSYNDNIQPGFGAMLSTQVGCYTAKEITGFIPEASRYHDNGIANGSEGLEGERKSGLHICTLVTMMINSMLIYV